MPYRNFLILGCLMGMLSACNTVDGIGQDLSSVGNSMSEAASDVRGDEPSPPPKYQPNY